MPRPQTRPRGDGTAQSHGHGPVLPTLEEADKVLEVMARNGLKRKEGLKVYVMCGDPQHFILAEAFAESL